MRISESNLNSTQLNVEKYKMQPNGDVFFIGAGL